MEEENVQNDSANVVNNPVEQQEQQVQIIDTQADIHMKNSEETAKSEPVAVLENNEFELNVPEQITDEFNRDLWRLKIMLQNRDLNVMRELAELGLPETLTNRKEQLGPYPALASEKRIYELVTRLWQQRDQTRVRLLQAPPYELQHNPERAKDQVINLIQTYVAELCNNFKPSGNEAEDLDHTENVENFDPIITKDQTLTFLQLAESLIKQSTGPTYHMKLKSDTLFKSLILIEDFEVLRCSMAICMNRDSMFNDRRDDVPQQIYYPIATCAYKLFPGESKPITKLLEQELPLKLDIEHDYISTELSPDGKPVKKKLVIPYAELSKFDSGNTQSAYTFLIEYLKQRQEELKLPGGDIQNWPDLQQILFAVCALRTFSDEAARQKCIQVWLQTMSQTKKHHIAELQNSVDFKTNDFVQDIFHLLKVTKNEQTCEQALALIRTFCSDENKLYSLLGIESLSDIPDGEVPTEQAPAWITNSFMYKLVKQFVGMSMEVEQTAETETEKQPEKEVEQSAFDVDMEEPGQETNKNKASVDPASYNVTRAFQDDNDKVICTEMLHSARVQICISRLILSISHCDRFHESRRQQASAAFKKLIEGVSHIRKLARTVLGQDSIHKQSEKVHLLKYHPIATFLLIEPCYFDVYSQNQLPAFQQLENSIMSWIQDKKRGVSFLYCESKDRNFGDSFELTTEYKGKIVQRFMQPLGKVGHGSDRVENRGATFPQRLADSQVLEQFRTQVIGVIDEPELVDFVNEFLEDFIKVLVKVCDKDAALISRLLFDRKANDDTEQENKSLWEDKGLIPLIYERVKNHVPAKQFMYSTLLDLTRVVCIQENAKNFLNDQGASTLQKIYETKCELPMIYNQENRIFYQVAGLKQDTFQNIQRNVPQILEKLSLHFNQTLDKIKAQSTELCQTHYTFMKGQSNQNYKFQRKLRVRMEQTEQFEQLYYNVSIIQGFTQSFHQQTQEMLSRLIESHDRIVEVLTIFENMSLFNNLSQLKEKLTPLFKIILYEPPQNREQNPDLQLQQLAKFKVFADRIKDLTRGFVSYLGHPLDQMPTYEQIMAEPSAEQGIEFKGIPCPFENLSRQQTISWYFKTINEHTNKIEKHIQNDSTRRDITLVQWEDALQSQILFQRIMPQRELQMFHETMLQSDADFNSAFKDYESKQPQRKKQVTQLRSALREKIDEKSFKDIVTKLAENRAKVDASFKYVTESHYEQYGLHLAEQFWFTKLNKMVYQMTKTVYQRQPPSNSMLEIIRQNFRETAKGLASLAKNVKLALPKFLIADEQSLEQLLQTLNSNSVSIKPINKYVKEIKGTILVHFASLDGLKVLAQYHTLLLKLQAEIESEIKSIQQTDTSTSELSEKKNISLNTNPKDYLEKNHILTRLIVNETHDSIVVTQNLLTQMMSHKGNDASTSKIYYMSDVREDGNPVEYTSMEHFFANIYNQFLTIIAGWQNENTDFAQMIQQDADLCYTGSDTVLMTLLKEAASNFVNCPMLKPNFMEGAGFRGGQNFLGGYRGQGGAPNRAGQQAAAQPSSEQPLRAPTSDELDMIMTMGFDVELASSALQMANFDVNRALELLLSGQEGQIIEFATRQRELKVQEEAALMQREMDQALKLSMMAEEVEEEKVDEEDLTGKLIEVPMIEVQDFRDKVQSTISKAVESMLMKMRSGEFNLKTDTILPLFRVALVGQPGPPGRHGEPGLQQKAFIELNDDQKDAQRTAIKESVDNLCKVSLQDGGLDQITQCVQRFEFDIKLREIAYQQIMQAGGKVHESKDEVGFLMSLISAISQLSKLIKEVLAASVGSDHVDEIKFYEDEKIAKKSQEKAELVELAVKIMNVSVGTIQLIHMIVISSSRDHEKVIKAEGQSVAEAHKKHSKSWVLTNQPVVLINTLKQLVIDTETARDQKATGKKTEVQTLAESTIECISLAATHILSLKHWHYLDEGHGYNPEWLKSTALEFALSYVKLGKRNDKFVNQLLSLAIYEYSTLPEISQNLLNVSLLYHTVFQTSSEEREKQEKLKRDQPDKAEEQKDADPNQMALETFFEGKLSCKNSKVSYKNIFSVLLGLHQSNPLDLAADQQSLIDCFKSTCDFSKEQADVAVYRTSQEFIQIAFKETRLCEVQKAVLDASKSLDHRFATLESIQKTRSELLSGDVITDQKSQTEPLADLEESKGNAANSSDAVMIQTDSKENKNLEKQMDKINRIIDQVKELTEESRVVRRIKNVTMSDQITEPTLRMQYNLLLKVAAFTQAYPDLTPRDDSFAQWFVQDWFPQVAWIESIPVKAANEEQAKTLLLPNGSLLTDQEKIERILNRLTGVNRFQSLEQRTVRLNLRVSMLEQALVGLNTVQNCLSETFGAYRGQSLDFASLAGIQLQRSRALTHLLVLKALISEETNAMKNRITVIPETFQKSIYYILLRGRPSKDKNQAPINLSKVVQGIIKLSDRMLSKQARMAALPAALPENIAMDVSPENANFLHSHMVCLAIGCLIDLCLFIQQHLHVRGKKRQQPSQRQVEQPEAPQIINQIDPIQNPNVLNFQLDQIENVLNINQGALIQQPQPQVVAQEPQPDIQSAEIGFQVQQPMPAQLVNENMIEDDGENSRSNEDEDDDIDDESNLDSNEDDDDDVDDDEDEERDNEEALDILNGNYGAEMDDDNEEDDYGEEMMDDDDMDDMIGAGEFIERRFVINNGANGQNRNQRNNRDIISQPRQQAEGMAPMWDIGMQDMRRRPEQQDSAEANEPSWTQEENQIQRALQLLQGVRLHPTTVPQGMPGENNQPARNRYGLGHPPANPNPFMDLDGRNQDVILVEDTNTIRGLTTVFKPLKAQEYFKSQMEFSKLFHTQLQKALDCLKKQEKKDSEMANVAQVSRDIVNLTQTIRSDSVLQSSEARSRHVFLDQQRHHMDQLERIIHDGHRLGIGGPGQQSELDMIEQIMERMRIHESNVLNIQHELGEPRFVVGGGAELRQNIRNDEGVGAAMASMNNQIIAENGQNPFQHPRDAAGGAEIMTEVMRLARGEDAGVFEREEQAEVQQQPGVRRRSFLANERPVSDPRVLLESLFGANNNQNRELGVEAPAQVQALAQLDPIPSDNGPILLDNIMQGLQFGPDGAQAPPVDSQFPQAEAQVQVDPQPQPEGPASDQNEQNNVRMTSSVDEEEVKAAVEISIQPPSNEEQKNASQPDADQPGQAQSSQMEIEESKNEAPEVPQVQAQTSVQQVQQEISAFQLDEEDSNEVVAVQNNNENQQPPAESSDQQMVEDGSQNNLQQNDSNAQVEENKDSAGVLQVPEAQTAAVDDPDQQMNDEQNVSAPIAEEEQKNVEVSAEEAKQAQQPAQEEEATTFGYPNSLLDANDIDPSILLELPEDIREAVLAPLQEQLSSYRAAQNQQRQRATSQSAEELKNQNAEGAIAANQANNAAPADAQQQQPVVQAPNAAPDHGIDQDFLNALPEDVRREVAQNPQQNMPGPGAGPEMDFISVIASMDDPALRREMLFQLQESQIRQLPENLRREYDQARDEQAMRIAEAEQERLRQREREARRQAQRQQAHLHGMQNDGNRRRNRDDHGDHPEDRKLDDIIDKVEKDIFERQEIQSFKTQAKFIERQLETEDTLIETVLDIIIQFADDKSKSNQPNNSKTVVSKEALENAHSNEIVFLIHKLDDMRQAQSSCHINRNKFANAFAQLLACEIDYNDAFKKLIIDDEEADEELKTNSVQHIEVDEEVKEPKTTMMIDTTQEGLQKNAGTQKSEQQKLNDQKKRSASLKLALILIGTMRVIPKNFRVHLLKGLLLQEDYFKVKGASVIQKQAEYNQKQGSELQPPLVIILRATDTVKRNLSTLETQLLSLASSPDNKEERKDLLKEVQQVKALLRNLNLLILDIFKEFDQVIEKILAQQKALKGKESTKEKSKNLTISPEALVSLTQLIGLPEIDKKQLQSLGRAFLLISKNSEQNWRLLHREFQKIGDKSLDKINDQLLQVSVRFQPLKSLSRSKSSNPGKSAQQEQEEEKKMEEEMAIPQLQLRSSVDSVDRNINKRQSAQNEQNVLLSEEDKKELSEMIVQDKNSLQVLKNTVIVYNFFSTEITSIKVEEEKKKAAASEEEKKEDQTLLSQESIQRQAIETDLKNFYSGEKMVEHMTLLNDVLLILQGSQQTELSKELMINLSCIFEAHLPDLHEIIKKHNAKAAINQDDESAKQEIRMKPIVQKDQALSSVSKVLSLFKNVDSELPDRLTQFSVFCLNNKKAINKLLQGKNRANLGLQLGDIVKYMPNLLDFESKREYFYKEIEKQRYAARARGGRLNVKVNRTNILQQSYQELNYRSAAELKAKIRVTFEGEAGIDASGLTREFYIELSRAMFNPDYSLFNLTSNGVSYYANSKSYINQDHKNYFKFIGRMVGKAIFDGQLLECFFARSLYKMMIGEELFFEDFSDMDNDCFRNYQWTLDNDVTNLGQYFAITRDYFGRYEEFALKENGSNIPVTNDNKVEYIEKLTFHKMYLNVKDQIDAFLGGFHEIISKELISIFNAKELELLISGLPNFDVTDLKANTQVRGYTMDSPQIIWLFELLESFDKHEQALFLQFVTGSSKIPLEGFKALQGMDGVDPFKVHKVREKDPQALPKSHTCFNTLDLPEYPVKDLMQERLLFAIRETSGFGIA